MIKVVFACNGVITFASAEGSILGTLRSALIGGDVLAVS
jgi:hypothetical protein